MKTKLLKVIVSVVVAAAPFILSAEEMTESTKDYKTSIINSENEDIDINNIDTEEGISLPIPQKIKNMIEKEIRAKLKDIKHIIDLNVLQKIQSLQKQISGELQNYIRDNKIINEFLDKFSSAVKLHPQDLEDPTLKECKLTALFSKLSYASNENEIIERSKAIIDFCSEKKLGEWQDIHPQNNNQNIDQRYNVYVSRFGEVTIPPIKNNGKTQVSTDIAENKADPFFDYLKDMFKTPKIKKMVIESLLQGETTITNIENFIPNLKKDLIVKIKNDIKNDIKNKFPKNIKPITNFIEKTIDNVIKDEVLNIAFTEVSKGIKLTGLKQYLQDDFNKILQQAFDGIYGQFYTKLQKETIKITTPHYGFAYGVLETNGNMPTCYIAFRGTADMHSAIFSDGVAVPVPFAPLLLNNQDSSVKVHYGFQKYWEACRTAEQKGKFNIDEFVNKYIKDKDVKVVITGHSLGAAAAVLEAAYLLEVGIVLPENLHLVTFAEPAPGNKAFGERYNFIGSEASNKKLMNYHWFANLYDPVPFITAGAGFIHFYFNNGLNLFSSDNPKVKIDKDVVGNCLGRHRMDHYINYINDRLEKIDSNKPKANVLIKEI